MRLVTTCVGIALAALTLSRASLADDPAPTLPPLAQMPANPVTSPAPAEKEATPTDSQGHGKDKHKQHGDTASAASAAATPAAAEAPAAPKKICRNMDVLGSKIPKRVCATPEEWTTFGNRAHEETQDGLRRLQDQGAIAPPSPGVSPSALPPTR